MRWIKLNLDNAKGDFGEFANSVIYPISSAEYLLFSDRNVLDFIDSFSVFVPSLGYKMAYGAESSNLRNLYDSLPFRCMYVNEYVWLQIPTKTELNIQCEPITELPENLKPFIDTVGNINPLLIFIYYSKENVEIIKKFAQSGFLYRSIKDLYGNISQLKKEIGYLIKGYPEFFEFLIRLPDVNDNLSSSVTEIMYKLKRESELKPESRLYTKIKAVDIIISYPDKIILKKLVDKLNEIKTLQFDEHCEISLRAECFKVGIPERSIFIEELQRYDWVPRRTGYYIIVRITGEILPHKFIAYLEDLSKILYGQLKEIVGTDRKTLSIKVKRMKILLPKDRYETWTKLIKKYKLEVKLGSSRGEPRFKGYFWHLPLDMEFLLGVDLTASENSILDEAFVLTRIGVKLILDGYLHVGTELLTATQKAIGEDIDFIKTGKEPKYAELRMCIYNYFEDKTFKDIANLINQLLERSPPFSSYDLDLCERYYKINRKYLNYSKSNDFLSLGTFVKIKDRLINEPSINKIEKYGYILKSILRSTGINADTLEYLRDLSSFLE